MIPALDGVSFSVKKGEIFGLLGPNGAGKTTIANIVMGIVTKDAGRVKLFGEEWHPGLRERMNVASAYAELMAHLTIYQNLKFFAKLYGVSNYEERIKTLLEQFGIQQFRDKKFYLLSAGEKMRANLCKGMINGPELLVLDEATVGLDPDIALQVREEIRNLGTTILFTSHNMDEVEELCHRVAFLHQGKILKIGTPKELTKLIGEQRVVIDFYPSRKKIEDVLGKLDVIVEETRGNRVVLRVPHTDRKLYDILEPLFLRGFKMRDLSIEKPSLEEVFIRGARGKL